MTFERVNKPPIKWLYKNNIELETETISLEVFIFFSIIFMNIMV